MGSIPSAPRELGFFCGLYRHFLVVALAALAFASPAHAWWNSEWTLRKKITVDATASGLTEPTGAVAVLVRLHEGDFRFASAKPDGSDLRFVSEDDKTLLPYHIEKIDPLLNEAFVWVKVPELKPGNKTTLWLYYGNSGNKAAKVEDAKGTYDGDMVLVYHFTEHGQAAYDSTGNGNNTLSAGSPTDGALIGSGMRLDGKSAIAVPASPSLSVAAGGDFTWSAWIKPAAPLPNAMVYSIQDGTRAFAVGVDNGVPFVAVVEPAGAQRSAPGAVIPPNGWKHLAVTASKRKITLYVDGDPYATLVAAMPALNSAGQIGGDALGGVGFVGDVDEMAIAKTARPGSAIKFAASSQGSDGARIVTLGDDEQETSWLSALKTGYIGVIIGSLSVDGWVVIGILGIMFVISWAVMIKKGLHLKKIAAGNEQFLKEWSQVANDLSVLENDEPGMAGSMGGRVDQTGQRAMRDSPIFQIYHIGTEEIAHRLQSAKRGGTAKVLSARSIQAIRASLDGGLVRETQKLNRNMVLLTIAISGGPFLGLLGTVVGVMITFAAVAQAGDVNVNAIAPGIAAALAATVAGLAVAIPALFGYNYLLTQIKGEVNDMHVFIDEFVAKMAEFYSETADAERALTRSPFSPSEA